MNCAQISNQLGFQCRPISEGLTYIQSPLTLAFDGLLIGAFVQNIGRGLVRITDNSDILFTAMTHGMSPNAKRAQRFTAIARESGITLSDNGELYTTCPEDQAGFYIARFIEAASRIGNACDDQLVIPVSKFEKTVGKALSAGFGKRFKRSFTLVGASGHQLVFPFVIDQGTPQQRIIQTISSGKIGKPSWGSVYGAVGKMGDLKSSGDKTRRFVVMQDGDSDTVQQATLALAQTASIIIYKNDASLIEALMAA